MSKAMTITGATRLFAILGDPLSKARTPEGMNALFAQHGIDAVMVPAEVDPAGFADAVAGFKRLRNCDGLVLTMPHKQAMCAHVDELRENGRRVGAINAARRVADGRWIGDMFDGLGYIGALRGRGVDPAGKRVHMIGAGGVARAMAMALAEAGIAALTLRDLAPGRASDLARAVKTAFPQVEVTAAAGDGQGCDILLNATPVGMRESDPLPCDPAAVPSAAVVSDVITKPEITPFLAAAQARGCTITSGKDMFEAQIRLVTAFLVGRESL
jgi:shikimate dehydrogenase